MTNNPPITPVILAGGKGVRLRPLTSNSRPKPFLKIGRYSLLQNTIRNVSDFKDSVIIGDGKHAARILSEAKSIGHTPQAVIAEPCARGTAAAIALAAFLLKDCDTLMAVMPSDHYFSTPPISSAIHVDVPLTIIGAMPRSPSTRYGYIRTDAQGNILRFVEKPDKAAARNYLREENIYWNTGIFITSPVYFLSLLQAHAPQVYKAAQQAVAKGARDGVIFTPDEDAYQAAPHIAVDYAVMEHIRAGKILPFCGQWRDVGCWPDYLRVRLSTILSF